ncbi:MAG TPA: ATP-binding protein, partial [Clostridiales bacterium]|nr:ATP-binding protein [Clostridiales bacterium]
AELQRKGHRAAVMDADVTGPSIPQMFGVHEKAEGGEGYILPVRSKSGVQLMSMNSLLPNETDPVIWRGPIIANIVEQFWTTVAWQDVDYMFVDMPPG